MWFRKYVFRHRKVYKDIGTYRAAMQLQKQLSRKVGDREYSKWVLVIPPDVVKKAELKEGQELKIKIKDKKLIIENI